MEILIFCNQQDAIALSLFRQLRSKGERVRLVTAENLSYATSWIHEIDAEGNGFTEIILQDGKIIRSDEAQAVWNRIRFFPMAHFKNDTDRFYAQNEMHALYYSFLKSIRGALINPVYTYDLALEEENMLYLNRQAINAGLPVMDYHFTTSPKWQSSKEMVPFNVSKTSSSVFRRIAPHLVWQNQPALFTEIATSVTDTWIVGDQVIGNDSFLKNEALITLTKGLKKILLQVRVAKAANEYKVSQLNTFPLAAPETVIEALGILLTKKTAQPQ